jgi:hypothetical protein
MEPWRIHSADQPPVDGECTYCGAALEQTWAIFKALGRADPVTITDATIYCVNGHPQPEAPKAEATPTA